MRMCTAWQRRVKKEGKTTGRHEKKTSILRKSEKLNSPLEDCETDHGVSSLTCLDTSALTRDVHSARG